MEPEEIDTDQPTIAAWPGVDPVEPEIEVTDEIDGEAPEPEAAPIDEEDVDLDGLPLKLPKEKAALIREALDARARSESIATQLEMLSQAETLQREQQAFSAQAAEILQHKAALNRQIKAFEATDWARLSQENPAAANAQWMQYQIAQQNSGRLEAAESQLRADFEQTSKEHQERAVEGCMKIVKKAIPEWSEEVAVQVQEYAIKKLGYTRAELKQAAADPRAYTLLFDSWDKNRMKARANVAMVAPKPAPQPAAKVSGRSAGPSGEPSDINKWVEMRNRQEAKARAAR